MNTEVQTTEPAALTPMVQCRILLTDCLDAAGTPHLDVTISSSNPAERQSLSNLFAAWFASNWTEAFTIFMRQAVTAEQERTGAQEVVENTPGPKLLGADGRVISVDSVGVARPGAQA